MKFGVLTISDSCYKKEKQDSSGPEIIKLVKNIYSDSSILYVDLVPDDISSIKAKLIDWSNNNCDVILTTGGTGLSPRDVTPEATKAIIEREVTGISYAMLTKSLEYTPFAVMSRAIAGVRNKCLIVNFPGSVKAVRENFEIISKIIPHAVSVIKDEIKEVTKCHESIQLSPSKVKVNSVAGRDRESRYPMLKVEEALTVITSKCEQTSDIETIKINDSLGRVLAEDVRSLDPLPPFPASIKDGYAVKASDGDGERKVVDAQVAGANPDVPELKVGCCVRISTGAPVPPGADAVVQVEDTELVEATEDLSQELIIKINKAPTVGQDIRAVGSDIASYSIVLNKGNVINGAEIGILAAVGRTTVKVFKRPRIGVISTGTEVQNPDEPLRPGHIRDTNKITLISLLKQYSYPALDCGLAKDDATILKHTMEKAFQKCDFIITSGGVSMGEFDLLKQVLVHDFDAIIHFGRVNMKPGKPTTFATCVYKGSVKTIFALPGNPVSATVTSLLFVIPALRYVENRSDYHHRKIQVAPEHKVNADKERPEYHRVAFTDSFAYINNHYCMKVKSTGNQISSRLNSFAQAHGLMLVPPNSTVSGPFPCYILNHY